MQNVATNNATLTALEARIELGRKILSTPLPHREKSVLVTLSIVSDGDYAYQEKLVDLVPKVGLSINPVREALINLANAGLITIKKAFGQPHRRTINIEALNALVGVEALPGEMDFPARWTSTHGPGRTAPRC